MYTPPHLLTLIERRMSELGMTQAQLGLRAFGKSDNTAIQSLKKGSSPAIDRLEAMASALGWEVYFGPPRRAPGLAEPEAEDDFTVARAAKPGFSVLPWLDPGPGKGSAPVAFLDTWLSSNALIIDNLAAANATVINLEGFDPKRTLAVIDKSAPRRGFGLWCHKEGMQTILSTTVFEKSSMILQSATPDLPARLVDNWPKGPVLPAGKVVWLGFLPPA
ncbi:MAG: helix-turn-helix transcriptional regulator [Rhodobacteraceae bacterium]|nr:helix-turn-helix transcriptional regulator [Paracoccaceae bacterium]